MLFELNELYKTILIEQLNIDNKELFAQLSKLPDNLNQGNNGRKPQSLLLISNRMKF
ncbi:MAG: hypothetical protein SCALA702_00720 [Melioribacteraceae bacterium]|nr:MAG: hypothetical protein SCALA702_00720 [Melioribacteraceae bacterium]